jgi:hypothetical protein
VGVDSLNGATTVTNQMFIPLDPASDSVFYRMVYP